MALTVSDRILARFRAENGSARLREHPQSYTLHPQDNLLTGLPAGLLEDFERGAGGELKGSLPKFCAVHSSSALAVNSFGPMRLAPDAFPLAGISGFEDARFEYQLPTGLLGTPPNLDFLAWGPGGTVAVESKFTEVLTPKVAKFAPSYLGAIERLSDPLWRAMFESLRREPRRFTYLDAAQLVKHYLGMRNSLKGSQGDLVLMYVFWEPANAVVIPEFAAHRAEVEEFAAQVAGSPIRFVPVSYADLWSYWDSSSSWTDLREHLDALRARYDWAL